MTMSEKKLTITVFAKNRKTKDGREFQTFFAKLPDGETVGVKFREEAGKPKVCPCNIDLRHGMCNLAIEKYTKIVSDNKVDEATGEVIGTEQMQETATRKVLWVSAWEFSAEEYRDTSMDAYF